MLCALATDVRALPLGFAFLMCYIVSFCTGFRPCIGLNSRGRVEATYVESKKNDLPPCARHCALLPSFVLEDGTFSSLQEATSFVVDLQVTMIAVTHARDKAKASIASDMQVDQPDL